MCALRFAERSVRRAGGSSAADPLIVAAWRLQRRRYVELLHRKLSEFWTARVDADQSHLRRLWRSFCDLLGRGRSPPLDIATSELHHYFDDKVDDVRSATTGADPPTNAPAPVRCELRVFTPVTQADVIALVRSLPDKQWSSDPLPMWLLKINVDVLAPCLCHLLNWSLEHGSVPSYKSAYVTPLLRKANMDPADVRSYRPISNLSVIYKLIERVATSQLVKYLSDNDLLPALQSAYRVNHSFSPHTG